MLTTLLAHQLIYVTSALWLAGSRDIQLLKDFIGSLPGM